MYIMYVLYVLWYDTVTKLWRFLFSTCNKGMIFTISFSFHVSSISVIAFLLLKNLGKLFVLQQIANIILYVFSIAVLCFRWKFSSKNPRLRQAILTFPALHFLLCVWTFSSLYVRVSMIWRRSSSSITLLIYLLTIWN